MDKGFTRTGRRSQYGGARRDSLEGKKTTELVNGGSDKEVSADCVDETKLRSGSGDELIQDQGDNPVKEESDTSDSKVNNSESAEFHGFDQPGTPSAATMVNKLVGKFEADLEEESRTDSGAAEVAGEDAIQSPVEKKPGQGIYSDSEDENPNPKQEAKESRIAPKKRPLAKLTEEFDEKPASPPPAKRQRKKSAKAREAAGDSLDNMRLLSDVSSEVTSSADVLSKTKAPKEESPSEVTSSANQGKKSQDGGTPAPTAGPVRGGRRPPQPVVRAEVANNPLYLKPFDLGWKRELVYRKTEPKGSDPGKRSGDIYYYTPQGKKVRSRVEIMDHLKGTDLSIDNFTFLKEPICLDDPSKEVIRDASVRRSIAAAGLINTPKKEKVAKTPKQKSAAKATSSPTDAPVADEAPSTPAGASNGTAGSPSPSSKSSITPRVVLKASKQSPKSAAKAKGTPGRKPNAESPKAKGRSKKDKEVSQSDSAEPQLGTLPSDWDPAEQQIGDSSAANSSSPVTWKPKNNVRESTQTCSIQCVGPHGVLGVIPTLQCRICLCLFHSECAGMGPETFSGTETIHSFVCKTCGLEPKDSIGATPAHRHVSGLSKDSSSQVALVGGMTTWLPSSSTVQVQHLPRPPAPPLAGPATAEPPAPPQTVATIGGQKFIVVPKHNVLSVSPAGGGHTAALASQSPASSQSAAPPAVYLVPYSAAGAHNPQYPHVNGFNESKRGKTADSTESTVESTNVVSDGKIIAQRNMENIMNDMSYLYSTLFHVMGYLKVQELLRASRVCRLWRDLSLHPSLWRTVRMKNSQVSDWDGFAAALRVRGTRVLDLRKMLAPGCPEDIENMWKEFCRVIGQADCLQRVELSRCPASVVEQLATSCPQLRVINAIAIKSEEVDLEPMNKLPLLEELRLKGTNGMNISKTLDPLLSCRLKHLSLTSIRNLGDCNVNVLSELVQLESLELGECANISENFGPDHLTKLTKLQRLRLEKGQVPGCRVIPLLESVAKLPLLEQLEIINFDVKPGFDKALASCKQVRRLLIIPTYITTSASTNHIVLCSLPLLADSLQHLVWGLTQELTRVTDLFIDQCEARKGAQSTPGKQNLFPGDCIPIIKPVVSEEDKQKQSGENGPGVKEELAAKMEVDEDLNKDAEKDEEKEKGEKKEESSSADTDDVETLAQGFRAMAAVEQTDDSSKNPNAPPVSILPIPKLHRLLVQLLPKTNVKILKVPFIATWRQTFPEMSSFQ